MRRFIILGVAIGVIVAIALFFTFHKGVRDDELVLFGNVDVRQVDLGFRVNGRVHKMLFEEGDFIPQGTLMGFLDKQPYEDLVNQAEANIEAVQVQLVNSESLLLRRQDLRDGGGVSEEDVENARASRDVFRANLKQAEANLGVALTNFIDTEVYAPIDGTILTRIKEPGSVVREADPIYTLSITNPVWIRCYVSEPNLGHIYPGMETEIFTDTASLPTYVGHIGFISPVSEFTPKSVETTELRTDLVYRLRVIVDNPDRYLKQGMPVTVKISLREKRS